MEVTDLRQLGLPAEQGGKGWTLDTVWGIFASAGNDFGRTMLARGKAGYVDTFAFAVGQARTFPAGAHI